MTIQSEFGRLVDSLKFGMSRHHFMEIVMKL